MNNTTIKNVKETSNLSFRGQPIPTISIRKNVDIKEPEEIVEMYYNLSSDEQKGFTINAVHLDEHNQLDTVMYSNGAISTVETAIALAENDMLDGFTTGTTRKGGRTLRSKPNSKGISLKTIKTF